MPDPPQDYNICPCCGTEFGYDDDFKSFAQLRQEWIAGGMRWFFRKPPLFWNPELQLAHAQPCMEQLMYAPVGLTISSMLPVYGMDSLMGTPQVHVGGSYYTPDVSMSMYSCFDMTAPVVVAGGDGNQQYELAARVQKCELALAS
jgi:hypothetical protein